MKKLVIIILSVVLLSVGMFGITQGQHVHASAQITVKPQDIEAGKILISQSDCKNCHIPDYALIGTGSHSFASCLKREAAYPADIILIPLHSGG